MNAVSETMFKVTNWVMKFSPIGVFGLIGMTIAEMGLKALLPLGLFVVIAYATMIIFVVVVLGIVAKIFHLRYWKTMHVVMEEIAIAFSTASSEATLPRLMAKTQKMGSTKGLPHSLFQPATRSTWMARQSTKHWLPCSWRRLMAFI